ncbi:MAG: SAM-dependent methyltransferase [Flavobacteriales bacterium]|nr:MAG: SAM-dependent methyltransferase [Flavobacteriales bacterium]
MKELNAFFDAFVNAIEKDIFVKITLSKSTNKSEGLRNVYIRLIKIKEQQQLSFTYRYKTNDQVKNYSLEETKKKLQELLNSNFKIGTLFTLEEDYSLRISKKGKIAVMKTHPSFANKLPETHDQPKKKRAELGKYLNLLGITDNNGSVIPKMADKFKQINKYLEIIENLIKTVDLPKTVNIVDMGSGKGYLTFALYDYLVNQKKMEVKVTGIEQRNELVDFCNKTARSCEFENLHFKNNTIQDYSAKKVDILIALHACDTATDDALSKAITANAILIITAPCCHKQIRQQLKGITQESPILKYGIFKERQYEMVTDTIRALILEKHQYNTKVFEFISNEHTRKNVMLVGQKSNKKPNVEKLSEKIDDLKKTYGIDSHYLEEIL